MRNPLRNFNYILYSEVNDKAIFVDPLDIDKTLPIAEEMGLKPAYLLNTHGHHDHIKGNNPFLEKTGAQHLKPKDGEKIQLSDSEYLETIYTPGHTKDHYCFILYTDGRAQALLSGDTLFNAGVGNCKNGGDVETLYRSVIEKLSKLPGGLILFPGHDYLLNNLEFAKTVDPQNEKIQSLIDKRKAQSLDDEFILTTLGEEREINPFLRLEKLGGKFQDMSAKEKFFELRALRDKW